jgi:hypothetical protein
MPTTPARLPSLVPLYALGTVLARLDPSNASTISTTQNFSQDFKALELLKEADRGTPSLFFLVGYGVAFSHMTLGDGLVSPRRSDLPLALQSLARMPDGTYYTADSNLY